MSHVERDGAVDRVEARPLLPVTFHGGIRENRLARTSADVRTVAPTIQGWAVALLFFLAAAAASKLAWGLLPAGNPGWAVVVFVALGVPFAFVARVAGLLILTDRTRFDRAAGRAVRRKLGGTVWSVDLREVRAVQCLYVGQEWTKSGWVRQYQINLVLEAAEDRRVPVCGEGGDPASVLALGRDLAEFLGVPVVDQTSPAAEAAPGESTCGDAAEGIAVPPRRRSLDSGVGSGFGTGGLTDRRE